MSGNGPDSPHSGNGNADNGHFSLRLNGGEDPRDAESTDLVRRFQAGERSAFTKLYELWQGDIQSYAFRSFGEEGGAEDVAHDVFAKALNGLPKFKVASKQSFRRWLFRIAHNQVIDVQKAASAIPTVPLPDEDRADMNPADALDFLGAAPPRPIHRLREEIALEASAEEPHKGAGEEGALAESCVAEIIDRMSDSDLAQVFGTLPKLQQQALALRFIQDLSALEVAEAMHCSVANVWQLQSRAIRCLAERLELVGERRIRGRRRDAMLRRIGPLPVLGARRFALSSRPCLPGSSRSSGMDRYSGLAQSARW